MVMKEYQKNDARDLMKEISDVLDADIESNPGLDEYVYAFSMDPNMPGHMLVAYRQSDGQITAWSMKVKPFPGEVPQIVVAHLDAAANKPI